MDDAAVGAVGAGGDGGDRRPPGLVARVDAFQRRHPWAGGPLAVAYKFFDDQSGYLTALITYYGFLSVFPLLLLMVTVLGFLLEGDAALQERLVDSALSQFPVLGTQLGENVQSLQGSRVALVIGVTVSLYGGLGVAQATQAAFNRVWAVPRNERPNPLLARVRSGALLLVLALGLVVTTILTALTAGTATLAPQLGPVARVSIWLLGSVVHTALFVLAFWLLTARAVPARAHLPGALTAVAGWQLLQLGGTYYVEHVLRGANSTYGLFGIVLGLMAWIYLGALTVVLAAQINAVRTRRLWPRSLLTPFTDSVDLTAADERAYASYARSERHKGFQRVDVAFSPRPDQLEQAGPPHEAHEAHQAHDGHAANGQ